ncbi:MULTISPECIES: TetR/AcrR family transcriptional regulator [unclassified Crossiella]|uniref:TetR/AcrR family transcriptional regulator n=1 Tax=unclassified Crossiella TaxID=2620835 RepID=UPI001FFEB9E6|nr:MULTISPECIES: TetR family transcriptional regulator C-terminal domain-containing protein [unclassified Crossiella]MCK2240285.1 TetR family transcriptional regulator C-terminal domain-containing protein [Crossiella sp. S99.2]MCK2253263.1 TetR family transcriptional regulator C-terminal domain-containing protein [Crossiella sp. S99.1]
MPDARRHAIGAALLRIVARDGLDGVSLRAVATEAETSLGMVQRQFADKDELLLSALRQTGAATAERIRRIPKRAPVLDTLRRIADELLPLDEQRIIEARVYYAFTAKAMTRTDFALLVQAQDAEFQAILTASFRAAEESGEIPPGQDHAALARLFSSALDGVSLALLTRAPDSPAAGIVAGLDAVLALITRP